MIEKTYEPSSVEGRIYQAWEEAGAFKAGAGSRPGAESYSIVIPPPNVTGSLHIGHALNNTIQDVLIRFERMRGKNVLWQPGTDHAGIATQMVVERQMMERQEPGRREIGREKFLEKVWEWKAESGGTILNQLKRLGASCDWSRERFTMDEGLSEAVLRVFVEMYRKGLIYRAKRLVNWDPRFETAISDIEVENTEVNGHMWHFKYPLADGETYTYVEKDADGNVIFEEERDYISIATTRPETMLGDGAVAVHPDDERYAPIVGKMCEIPVGPKEHRRLIPIITDEYPDPTFGSGAVKITGAHDFNDYEVARRNNIPMYSLLDTKATLRADGAPYAEQAKIAQAIARGEIEFDDETTTAINIVPDEYRGLDRYEARKRIVADIDAEGLMVKVEDKKIMQPFGDRSKVVIEPFLTDQWFVKADVLAQPAIASVREGRTKFVPKSWENTYFNWMENIQPWCISRQLWWGHQIPAWYGPDGEVFVDYDEAGARRAAEAHYGEAVELTRDEDVLDTWFSSGLWPFSTMGWPKETDALKAYYPTSTLVTGFDIIFFWVARMMMLGLEFTGEEPFETIYVHALVRDEKGQKMSKSKGNVIDPLELVDAYGADATRFTLAAMAAQGRDLKLATSRVEGYRNFVTKLWNAARFLEMNECVRVEGFDPAALSDSLNQWIAGATSRAAANVTRAIEDYKFNEAANHAYDFVWGTFCDWFVELAKPTLSGDDAAAKAETRATAAWALDQILKMLHPFMPFVTEELWAETGKVGPARDGYLMLSDWPELDAIAYPAAEAELNWLIEVISAIRSVRTEMNVPAGAKVPLVVVGANEATVKRIASHGAAIERLARVSTIETDATIPQNSAQFVVGEANWGLPLADLIDISAERQRLDKDVKKLDGEIGGLQKKLGNEQFLAKAPEEIIEEQKERLAEAQARREKLRQALDSLS
ncbi:valine--tRNA ligase [Pelagibacterium sp. 26DY04]|uniref:valine--tRNA ligase n=1 Tax=Pelagibacterium sp. 26DY04 TaxID=2967130 RepID=UPI00281552D5|nr:valine--tRNA ligase [Pelagibacterium sp. 26DY04]WMT88765.1 valine--tRNA ligase [Pelagibacterium sp. 26DY04]